MKEDRAVFEAALVAQTEGRPAALATVTKTQGSVPRQAGSKMLVWPDGKIVGTVGGGQMEAFIIEAAQTAIRDGQPRMLSYTLSDIQAGDPGICGGSVEVFVEPLIPPPTLVVVGCGHVGQALAELGKWMQFRVVVTDDRPDYATPEIIPGMDQYFTGPPEELIAQLQLGGHTAIACVTRGLPVDQSLIPVLLETDAAYIGLIGSRRRWALTVKTLVAQGLARDDLARIHAPIGLELQAETPKEIALSIMAEIVMVLRGGSGAHMRWMGPVEEATSGSS